MLSGSVVIIHKEYHSFRLTPSYYCKIDGVKHVGSSEQLRLLIWERGCYCIKEK